MIGQMRRNAELGLILLGVVITGGAYTLASLGRTSSIPANIGPFLGVVLALLITAHIAVRKLAPERRRHPAAGRGAAQRHRLRVHRPPVQARPEARRACRRRGPRSASLAFIATLIVVRRVRDLERYRYTFALIGLALLILPLVPGVGVSIFGSRIWVRLGPVSFQPGEFAKIVLAIFFAAYLVEKRELLGMATWPRFRPMLPDPKHLGPVVLAWVRRDRRHDRREGPRIVAAVLHAVRRDALGGDRARRLPRRRRRPVRRRRLWRVDAVRPRPGTGDELARTRGRTPSDKGLQVDPVAGTPWPGAAWPAPASGSAGPDKIPVVDNDFIFAAIGEELGLLGATAVLMAYLLMVGAGLRIAVQAEGAVREAAGHRADHAARHPGFIIIAGVTRLLPLTGITLPFVSYGGSSLVANYILLALLLRISDDTARRDKDRPGCASRRDGDAVNTQIRRLGVVPHGCASWPCSCSSTTSRSCKADDLNTNPATPRRSTRRSAGPAARSSTADGVGARPVGASRTTTSSTSASFPRGICSASSPATSTSTFGATGLEASYNDELAGRTTNQQIRDRCPTCSSTTTTPATSR